MATTESTTSGLSLSYYMRNFYRSNPSTYKASARKNYTETELSYEDARALKRAAKRLMDYDISDDDTGEDHYEAIQAFVDTYNNAMDSSSSISDRDISRSRKNLEKLTQKYSDELEDIGISIQDDGSLKITEGILKNSSGKELKKVFSKESGLMSKTQNLAKKLNQNSYNLLYTQITGNGGRLNISL